MPVQEVFCPRRIRILRHPADACPGALSIPRPDASYDVLICTQALHYVRYPQQVINEFHRILKPGGRLFLTAAQGWGLTGIRHYYNFSCYALASLFEDAGFEIEFIRPRGGMFWYMGNRCRSLTYHIMSVQSNVRKAILYPFWLLSFPFLDYVIPLACFYLDRLDRLPSFTLGYACHCRKPSADNAAGNESDESTSRSDRIPAEDGRRG